MSRYRRNEDKNLLTYIVLFIVSAICTILSIVYWGDIKAFIRGDESKTEQVGGSDETPDEEKVDVSVVARDDLEFERVYIRFTPAMTESSDLMGAVEFYCDEDLSREVLYDENRSFVNLGFDYDDYESYISRGKTHEQALSALLVMKAEENEMTLEEFGADLLDHYSGFSCDRTVDEYGAVKTVIRGNFYMPEYEKLNTRRLCVVGIVTKTGDSYSYDFGTFGNKAISDMSVSPSFAYMAAMCANQMMSYEMQYNDMLYNKCVEVVKKACAQSQGLIESDYTTITSFAKSKTVTAKVGEKVKLVPDFNYIELPVYYYSEFNTYEDVDYSNATLTYDGTFSATKAGTYKLLSRVAGVNYYFTVVVE